MELKEYWEKVPRLCLLETEFLGDTVENINKKYDRINL